MDILLEDRVALDMLKLGLEILQTSRVRAAVGSATCVGHGEATVLDFLAIDAPGSARHQQVLWKGGVWDVDGLTSLPCRHRSSWPSLGRHRHGRTLQSNEGDVR